MAHTGARKLFILGHARSGTTILARLFNSAEEVLLLGEAHLFESYWNTRFVDDFNGHHMRTKKVRSKGTRLPPHYAGMLPEAILDELAGHYQWVGEKVAIGPMAGSGTGAAARAVDYFQARHPDACYVLCFRAPLPSLQSLHKLFPTLACCALLQGWMLSLIEIGAASNLLKRVCVLPLEQLTPAAWTLLQDKLGIAGRADQSWIDPRAGDALPPGQETLLVERIGAEMQWEHVQAQAFCARLDALYRAFLDTLDPATLYYKPSVSFARHVAQGILGDLQDMLAELAPASARAVLPASVCGWLRNGVLQADRRPLALPSERAQRFGAIVADSLCGGSGGQALLGAGAPHRLQASGIDLREEGPWLRLDAQAGASGHRHLGISLPIRTLDVATVRLLLRREPATTQARYLMLQTGDASGFYKCVFDCQELRLHAMEAHGPAKSLFAQIEQLANGAQRLSMSGILSDGQDSYVRLYMCDPDGSVDPAQAPAPLALRDWVLAYGPGECGLGT